MFLTTSFKRLPAYTHDVAFIWYNVQKTKLKQSPVVCRLPEESAKFYAAEVLLALEYLHKQNIIYRDLKVGSLDHQCVVDQKLKASFYRKNLHTETANPP